jgi:hypothetical protein
MAGGTAASSSKKSVRAIAGLMLQSRPAEGRADSFKCGWQHSTHGTFSSLLYCRDSCDRFHLCVVRPRSEITDEIFR